MSRVLLVGAGAVGLRAARQLGDSAEVDTLLVADVDRHRARAAADALGSGTEAVEWDSDAWLPEDVDAVAVAAPGPVQIDVAARCIAAGTPVATTADEPETIAALRDLDEDARRRGIAVVAGAALAPGLADVMARHAADDLDAVTEVHVAREGSAGEACERSYRRILRGEHREWRDGAWADVPRRRRDELVWFPDPTEGRECRSVEGASALLVAAFPEATRVSYRLAVPRGRVSARVERRRLGEQAAWGAARVEVWGRRGRALETVVYGVIEHTAVAAGTVLAVTAARLADRRDTPRGVVGLASYAPPAPFLAEMAERGVKIAVFEGMGAEAPQSTS